MSAWHVRIADGESVGPIATDLVVRGLVAGRVPPDALVRKDGETRWLPIGRVPEFREAVRHAGPASRPNGNRPGTASDSLPPSSGPTSAPIGRKPTEVLVAHPAANRQPLGPLERRVVSMLDGARSIEEIAALVALTVRETTSICEYLVALGVAKFAERPQDVIELSIDDAIEEEAIDGGWSEQPPAKK